MVPTLATLAGLASALEVSLADLVDPSRPLPPPDLPDEERHLLEAWKSASPRARELVIGLLEELSGK